MGIMYFCISTPATVTETDAAKSASEQDLSGGAARCCSVASLTHAARSAPQPYDHKRISGATDYQGHHGMKLLVVSHKLQGHARFKNYFKREVEMFSETQVMIFFCLGSPGCVTATYPSSCGCCADETVVKLSLYQPSGPGQQLLPNKMHWKQVTRTA